LLASRERFRVPDVDFVDDFDHAGKMGHGFLGQLLLEVAAQTSGQVEPAVGEAATDMAESGVKATAELIARRLDDRRFGVGSYGSGRRPLNVGVGEFHGNSPALLDTGGRQIAEAILPRP